MAMRPGDREAAGWKNGCRGGGWSWPWARGGRRGRGGIRPPVVLPGRLPLAFRRCRLPLVARLAAGREADPQPRHEREEAPTYPVRPAPRRLRAFVGDHRAVGPSVEADTGPVAVP